MDLTSSSAVVSGGAGGLGGATTCRLVELGVAVVILDPGQVQAEALAGELGGRVRAVVGDQNDDDTVGRAIEAAQQLGRFSIAVNSAGVVIRSPATATADGEPHDLSTFREMIDMHLIGPFNVARLVAAAMASNEPDTDGARGVIINTSSVAAFDGQARQVAYSAAKGGVASMTLAMARDLGPLGIRVNAIAPGPTMTPRFAGAPQELKDEYVRNIAFPKRVGSAEEFASLVEGIVRTGYLNGQTIRLDGAMSTPLAQS